MRTIIGAALALFAAPALAADAPYAGEWDCGGYGTLTISGTRYDFGEPATIAEVSRDGPSYILTMTDGYVVAVAVEGGTLNWFSPESGDGFECRRR